MAHWSQYQVIEVVLMSRTKEEKPAVAVVVVVVAGVDDVEGEDVGGEDEEMDEGMDEEVDVESIAYRISLLMLAVLRHVLFVHTCKQCEAVAPPCRTVQYA